MKKMTQKMRKCKNKKFLKSFFSYQFFFFSLQPWLNADFMLFNPTYTKALPRKTECKNASELVFYEKEIVKNFELFSLFYRFSSQFSLIFPFGHAFVDGLCWVYVNVFLIVLENWEEKGKILWFWYSFRIFWWFV